MHTDFIKLNLFLFFVYILLFKTRQIFIYLVKFKAHRFPWTSLTFTAIFKSPFFLYLHLVIYICIEYTMIAALCTYIHKRTAKLHIFTSEEEKTPPILTSYISLVAGLLIHTQGQFCKAETFAPYTHTHTHTHPHTHTHTHTPTHTHTRADNDLYSGIARRRFSCAVVMAQQVQYRSRVLRVYTYTYKP